MSASEPSGTWSFWPVVAIALFMIALIGGTSLFITRSIIASDIEKGLPVARSREQQRDDQHRAVTRLETLTKLLQTLKDSLQNNPNDSMLVISAANISYDLGQFTEATGYYRRFLRNVDPHNSAVRIDFAYALFQTGDQELGIRELKGLISEEPGNQTALINLAVMYAQRKQYDEAKQWFERCKDVNPTSDLGKRARAALEQLETQT